VIRFGKTRMSQVFFAYFATTLHFQHIEGCRDYGERQKR
jgi:hypothetical protein